MKWFALVWTLSAAALTSHAGLLYWMVDESLLDDAMKTYDYAIVTTTPGGAGLNLTDEEGIVLSPATTHATKSSFADGTGMFVDLGSTGPGSSYLIELYNGSGLLGSSSVYSYSALVESGAIRDSVSLIDPTTGTPWNGGTFTAAPEPTSGVLILLGLAGLGLRRRRKV